MVQKKICKPRQDIGHLRPAIKKSLRNQTKSLKQHNLLRWTVLRHPLGVLLESVVKFVQSNHI